MIYRDPLWVSFPRWIELSGLPQWLNREVDPLAWLVFRKLVELECDANLTPDWFSVSMTQLSELSGISVDGLLNILTKLEHGGWIDQANTEQEVRQLKIASPLWIPKTEDEIRTEIGGGNFIFRYMDDLGALTQVEKVIFLYQMLFGARFTPRIVEDLEEIANTYPMGVIYDTFKEAYHKKVKSLSWVKTHLRSDRDK